jgi:hypothetical protein
VLLPDFSFRLVLISAHKSAAFGHGYMRVLVASGVDFDVDEYVRDSPFKPQRIYRHGETASKNDLGFMGSSSSDPDGREPLVSALKT